MAINTAKVAVGGIAAAVVNLALGFVAFGMWLGPKMNAEMDAVIPGASAKMMGGSNMVWGLVGQAAIGFLLVWTYAAMRPRFGPGPKTAVFAALPVWISGAVFYMGYMQMGTMSSGSYWTGMVVSLVTTCAASVAGAMLYKEEG